MFQLLKILLLPFSVLYGIVVRIRHFLYDIGVFKSVTFTVPTICVGNISFGGTGKTPMIEFLIQKFSEKYRVGVVSRGYKRKSKGLVLATSESKMEDLGDEPYQFWRKFPNILLAIDSNRKNAIENLLNLANKPEIILLDDAFQHRKIKATKNIVLTDYNHLFTSDFLLPSGTLRDVKSRVKKADALIVTKCPSYLTENEQLTIKKKLKKYTQKSIFFTKVSYSEKIYSKTQVIDFQEFIKKPFTLVTGIANPQPLVDFLKEQNADFKHLKFADHHHFSAEEIEKLRNEQRILTTEKDFVRIENDLPTAFYLPIEIQFISKNDEFLFIKLIFEK